MSIFDRDFSQIDAAVVAGGSAAMIRNVLQAALDEIALLRKERGAFEAALAVAHSGDRPAASSERTKALLEAATIARSWMVGPGNRPDDPDPETMAADAACHHIEEEILAIAVQPAKPRCSKLPTDVSLEPACNEPFYFDDGVPYCETCGLYRASKHRSGL